MTREFPNGAIAGAIAAVIAFLAWHFLKHAGVMGSLLAALGFFVVTCALTMVISNNVKMRRARG